MLVLMYSIPGNENSSHMRLRESTAKVPNASPNQRHLSATLLQKVELATGVGLPLEFAAGKLRRCVSPYRGHRQRYQNEKIKVVQL
ncbi:hypothetical protein LXL04_012162 [Taraxacum kok-saghyz]